MFFDTDDPLSRFAVSVDAGSPAFAANNVAAPTKIMIHAGKLEQTRLAPAANWKPSGMGGLRMLGCIKQGSFLTVNRSAAYWTLVPVWCSAADTRAKIAQNFFLRLRFRAGSHGIPHQLKELLFVEGLGQARNCSICHRLRPDG